MCPKILCILVVTLGFSAVASRAVPAPGPSAPAAEYENSDDTKLEQPPKGAFVPWRQIGMLKKGVKECPTAAGWETRSLLDQARLEAEKIDQERIVYLTQQSLPKPQAIHIKPAELARLQKLGLDRVCVYTADDTADPLNPQPLPPGLKAAPDRLALSTTSAGGLPTDSLSQAIWQALATHFREQTLQSRDASGVSRVPIPLPAEPNVRLTFIDSQPDGEGFPIARPTGSPHGFTLAYLARGVVCPVPEHCAALVATRRALSFREFTPGAVLPGNELRDDQSGHVGLVNNLATAIIAEVLHWQQVDPDKKLILNLSLGWDGELFGDLGKKKVSKLDPAVQSVYNALRFARRSGALVIAAAGNQRDGSEQSTSPLLPAAWELNRPTWLPFFLGRKPVYAVGGVDWQGMPLPNSRRGGLPRRVAYADHAVAEALDEPTAIYTGTSVSAAAASSIAAVIWHLRPDLSPAQVMRLVTRSGNRLPARADFYAWNVWPLSKIFKAPHAKGLSLCRAVARACRPDGGGCLALAALPACPAWTARPPEVMAALQALRGTDGRELPPGSPPAEWSDAASQRWVLPQPEATPCPGCTLIPGPPGGATSMLVLETSQWTAENPSVGLTSATLDICGSQFYSIPLPSDTRVSVLKFPVPASRGSLRDCTAQIIFRAGPVAILNPVLVHP